MEFKVNKCLKFYTKILITKFWSFVTITFLEFTSSTWQFVYIYKLPSEITGWPGVSTFLEVIYFIERYYKTNFYLDLFEGNW